MNLNPNIFKKSISALKLIYFFCVNKFDKKVYTENDIPKLTMVKYGDFDVYIGRTNKHLNLKDNGWGNPFPIDSNGRHIRFKERMRVDVLSTHMNYIRTNRELLLRLKSLSGKTLGCYCCSDKNDGVNKWCHGHNIIQMYKERVLNYKIETLNYKSNLK